MCGCVWVGEGAGVGVGVGVGVSVCVCVCVCVYVGVWLEAGSWSAALGEIGRTRGVATPFSAQPAVRVWGWQRTRWLWRSVAWREERG